MPQQGNSAPEHATTTVSAITGWGMALAIAVVSAAFCIGCGDRLDAQTPPDDSSFILSDQDSEVYYSFAVAGGEDVKVEKDGLVTGDLHSNDKIDLKKDSTVDGDVSAVGKIKNKGVVTGTVTEDATALTLPEIFDEAAWRALADRVFEDDQTFVDLVIDDVVFVDGKVEIEGNVSGVGTIIATRDIRVEDGDSDSGGDSGSDSNGDGDSDSGSGGAGPIVLDDETRLSLISFDDVELGKNRPFRGVLRAGRDVKIKKGSDVFGVIVADRKIDLDKEVRITFVDFDPVAPEIVLVAPPDGGFAGTAMPEIVVEYSDDFSGLRLDSLELLLDGVDRVADATVGENGLTFTPAEALSEGVHTLEVAITDRSDNEARESFSFTVDLTPPALAITAPSAPFLNDATPRIEIEYADALAGVDLATLSIQVDGVELVATCTVGPAGASCESPALAEGGHQVTAVVADAVGNAATASFVFTVDLTPPEITATLDPAANADGWNATDVTVSFDCQDALAGIVVCPDPVVVSGDCVEQEVTGSVDDQAGNRASTSVTVRVDRLPPAVSGVLTPAPNAAGWNNAAVTVSFVASDDCSAIAAVTAPVELAGEGANQSVTGTATDLAGNSASATVVANVDLTPPQITATADPAPNAAGWNNVPVTVSFDCQDSLSGVASCPDPVTLSGDGADQAASGTVFDVAGNSASVTLTVSIDRTPPAIGATAAPPANAAGWNATDVTVSFDCQDALSGVASCPAAQVVSGEGAGQVVSGIATDVAGNSASASATVSIDRTPPIFDPAELRPLPCPELSLELQPQVRACFADVLSGVAAGTVQLLVDGVDRTAAATVAGGCVVWDPPDALIPGEHQATVFATDQAGNDDSVSWCFEVASPALDVAIDTPGSGLATRDGAVDVTGTVDPLADTVEVNGVAAAVGGGSFQALGVPLREGKNVLTAVARNAGGGIGTASVTVSRDTTPPVVRIETPRDGAVLTSLQVDVAGLVNDLITGTTINADDCQVSINGVEAAVANRTFIAPDLLLKRGVNALTAEARDRLGNVATHSIQVTVQDQAGQRILLLAGNNQSGDIFAEVADPLIVALESSSGDAVAFRPVTFTVTRGDGTVRAFPQEGETVTVLTDELGHASVRFELSGRSGAGNNRVLATAPGFIGEVEFCASAAPSAPARITTVSGNGQRGVVERGLPLPLLTLVTDIGGNPVSGVDVTFEVGEGGGSFAGASTAVVTTDLDGLAQAIWTLGPDEGINNNTARATFPGLSEAGATFTASAQRIGRPADTRISGLVLDNQDNPIPGATVTVEGTPLVAVSDDQGQFIIPGAPVGSLRVLVDGSTTTRPGNWPRLEIDLTTISGRNNVLERPAYILPLASAAVVGGAADVTLLMDNVPGAELTVFAHSVTCPDGSPTCEVSVTQVRGERVPMEPPLGSSFMLAWTIQAPGTRFDPPARLCIPNADQQPGQQVEMFSFDHDQGEFVAVGTATVTADGSQICSDPGFGVVKSGWFGCVPPPPPCVPGGAGSCKDNDGNVCTEKRRVSKECGFDCEPVDTDGRSCDDKDKCTEMDMCMGNSCKGEEIKVEITEAPTAICEGTSKPVSATVTPSGRAISWMSSDPSLLTVSGGTSGMVTAAMDVNGNAQITAKDAATDCSSDSRNVRVIELAELDEGMGEYGWCAIASFGSPDIGAACGAYVSISWRVKDWSNQQFAGSDPSCNRGNGAKDAARHARWACELHSSPITEDWAETLLDLHERNRDGDTCPGHEMDFNNNEVGRQNAEAGRDCAAEALQALRNGQLQVNSPPNPGVSCP